MKPITMIDLSSGIALLRCLNKAVKASPWRDLKDWPAAAIVVRDIGPGKPRIRVQTRTDLAAWLRKREHVDGALECETREMLAGELFCWFERETWSGWGVVNLAVERAKLRAAERQ